MDAVVVSTSTKRNWRRLGTDGKNRLLKGANKSFSVKKIIPLEYFKDKDNREYLSNVLKVGRKLDIKSVIYTLALKLLHNNGLILLKEDGNYKCDNKYLAKILKSGRQNFDKNLLSLEFPSDESDFLGIVYQSLLKEGSKNINGSYYTPKNIITDILKDLPSDSIFLDPCCGTGSFLLTAADKISNPENLYGVDKDETACFISKINLIIKFKDKTFNPNIYNSNFLTQNFLSRKFDVIATNPPWGAAMNEGNYSEIFPEISSGESFSYFIVKSRSLLNKNGRAIFVLPQSVLNIASHKDVRRFILKSFSINRIILLGRAFSKVMAYVTILDLGRCTDKNLVKIYTPSAEMSVNQDVYRQDKNFNFSILSNKDFEILKKIYSIEYNTLKKSTFALGIVTGNNGKYIISHNQSGYEKIYTGKEVGAYFLKPARKYIKYERKNFQQVAPDDIYRAADKLVYKFISPNPVFAYDATGSLFLNSANIIIPSVDTHTTKTILAFLNSGLFKYIYAKKFNDLKMLKSNLLRLPFPVLKEEQLLYLTNLTEVYLKTKSVNVLEEIEEFVYSCFNLNSDEINYIKSCRS